MTDFFPIPDINKVQECLIFGIKLGLKKYVL